MAVGTELPSIGPFAILIKRLRAKGLDKLKKINMKRHLPWSITNNELSTRAAHGWALDLGVHDAGLLRSALGEAKSVEATGENRYDMPQLLKMKFNYADSDAIVECEVGASPDHKDFHHSFEVEWTDGSALSFNQHKSDTLIEFDGPNGTVVPVTRTMQETFGEAIRVVTDFFRGHRPNAGHFDAQHHVDTLRVLKKAQESAASKGVAVMLA